MESCLYFLLWRLVVGKYARVCGIIILVYVFRESPLQSKGGAGVPFFRNGRTLSLCFYDATFVGVENHAA